MPGYLSVLWAEGTEWGRHAGVNIPRLSAGLSYGSSQVLREIFCLWHIEKRRQLYFLTVVLNNFVVLLFVVNMFISYRYENFASLFLTFSSNNILLFLYLRSHVRDKFHKNWGFCDAAWCPVTCLYCELRARNGVDTLVSASPVYLLAHRMAVARY